MKIGTECGRSGTHGGIAVAAAFVLCASTQIGAARAQSESQIAQDLTNPVADLIQVPFQNNFDWGGGRQNNAFRYTLNVQPVIPFSLTPEWNLVTRTIVPFASFDRVFPTSQSGMGDILQSYFLSPARPTSNGVVWGVGPVFLFPTATNPFFASKQWGVGPTGVILQLNGPWTYGVLANHVWSLTPVASPTAPGAPVDAQQDEEMIAEGPTTQGRWRVNNTFVQPFISYSFPTFTTVSLTSETQYNWTTRQWTVPIAAGVSQLVKLGGQIFSIGATGRYWVERPAGGPTWGLRATLTWVLPNAR